MVHFSSFLTFIHLLLCIVFLKKSSAEFYKDNEDSKYYDDFQSENELHEFDRDDRYNPEQPFKLYEEEELRQNYEIISDEKNYESDGVDRYNEELPSKLDTEEETDGARRFRQNGNLNLVYFD